jgi:hypothetical protein
VRERLAGRPALAAAALWIAGALISGFTLRWYLDPLDEGLLMQGASRIAAGQWPYLDFGWPYGPGHPLLLALADKTLGPSVLWWRVVRVGVDATIGLLAYGLVRRGAGARWALAAWLPAVAIVAQPPSPNPGPVALALSLGAVLVAGGGAVATPRRAAAAGLLSAAAAFWRPDMGLVAAVAVVAALLARGSRRAAALAAGTAALAAGALYAPFAVAAGPGRLWEALVVASARDGSWWRLPFPLLYDGRLRAWPPGALASDLKDAVGYERPLLAVLLTAGAVLVLGLRRTRPRGAAAASAAGVAVLAAGALVYLRTRPDELHAQPLLVLAVVLAALAAARGGVRRPATVLLAAGLALVASYGVANRVVALLRPPELVPLRLDRAEGVRVPPAEAAALPRVVAAIRRLVPPGEPIYVAPRRSDLVTRSAPLLHFLADRPNVLRRDVLVQARPAEQAAIVAVLERVRPRVVVRWTDPASSQPEPNRRGRPSGSRLLDEHLARAYRLAERDGAYDVLVRRP